MSPRSKREYTEAIYLRYKNASRRGKTAILDEFCTTCGYHRKYAIRLLRRFKRFTKPKPKRRGRPCIYSRDIILKPLKKIWLASNLPFPKQPSVRSILWRYQRDQRCRRTCQTGIRRSGPQYRLRESPDEIHPTGSFLRGFAFLEEFPALWSTGLVLCILF